MGGGSDPEDAPRADYIWQREIGVGDASHNTVSVIKGGDKR
ncbi:hypothetical protein PLANPX_5883 [Lacipirellula parvula]|uniref:Uncharacterized protein n=1 Tax=Lacipirellula parvula TaxID=2650471 RepID=A0A5K7XLP0_9BACT|nr:hypothetical protein PLANPX_5883 [Lacipirellula parvula]